MMMVPASALDINNRVKTLGEILGSSLTDSDFNTVNVNKLSLDSRNIEPGDVFVALKGDLYDGKKFIHQAFEKGAVAVLVDSNEIENLEGSATLPVIAVSNLNENLSAFSSNFYNHPSNQLSVVGITGTNGKTSCAQFFAQAVALLNMCCGVIGTTGFGVFHSSSDLNRVEKSLSTTGMTTPDPINVQKILAQFVANDVKYCAMEVSSHGLVQHRVAAVTINTAVFTNLSHDHLDYHGTMAAYGHAKAQLFCMPSVKYAVINMDDDYADTLLDVIGNRLSIITYSIVSPISPLQADVHFSIVGLEYSVKQLTKATLLVDKDKQQTHYSFATTLVGQFNISNLLAVIAALYAEGFELEHIVKIIQEIKTIDGRMESIDSNANVQAIVDFAHTPDALEQVLLALKPSLMGALWCVFGCGGDRDKTKRAEMAGIAEKLADHIVITSDNPRSEDPESILDDIEKGFNKNNFSRIANRAEAIHYAIASANKHDTIIIAGKGHEKYQIIGTEKQYFSDQMQAKAALEKREKELAND